MNVFHTFSLFEKALESPNDALFHTFHETDEKTTMKWQGIIRGYIGKPCY
ncbi:hypothetical protein KSS87_007434 [Heliosperma pusillum]|nr:hypothetical protein KSS87_007434 [Heliosperma pusillum]